jgi:hypothetical protein
MLFKIFIAIKSSSSFSYGMFYAIIDKENKAHKIKTFQKNSYILFYH